jgi:hypothetical protein
VVGAISGIIFENSRGFLEIYGLRVNIEQVQGLLCKVARIFGFLNYFPMGKGGGLGPWLGGPRRVAGPWFHRGLHSCRRQGLTGAQPNGRSGPRRLAVRVAMRRVRHRDRGIAHHSLDGGEEVAHQRRGFGSKRLRCGREGGGEEVR